MNDITVHPATRSEVIHSIMPLLLVIARRLRLLTGIPLLCGVLAVIYSLVSDPIYTATARILPPQYNENTVMAMQNDLGGASQLGNAALTLQNPVDLFVGILSSRTIMDSVIVNNDLEDYYGEAFIAEARNALNGATTIRSTKDGIVSIAVEDNDREMAAQLANSYVNEFYRFSESLAREQATRRSNFYRISLDNSRNELSMAEERLLNIEKQTGFTRLGGQDQAIVLAAAELQAQISAREIQLKTMSGYATESNPDYRLVNRELESLRAELNTLKGENQDSLLNTVPGQAPFVGIGNAPDAMLAHTQARRDMAYWENIVMLIGRYSELGAIDESRDMSLFQVLDWAIPPHDKSKPRTKVNAILAVIGSGFMCLLWILACAYIEQRCAQSDIFRQQWQELKQAVFQIIRHPLSTGKSA